MISYESNALREEGMRMLSSLEDRKFLEQIVSLIHRRYMAETVELKPNGEPITRASLLGMMEQANDSIEQGEGISDEEMGDWIDSLPE